MSERIQHNGLQVAAILSRFIDDEALPGTGLDSAAFWQGFDALVHDLAPKNRALLAERDRLQAELDAWHRTHPGPVRDMAAYRKFSKASGYLLPQGTQTQATTAERRHRDLHAGRPATGRAGVEPALRAERGKRALGQPL